MNRIYFIVPYLQSSFAKRFGARWDPSARAWYAENEEVLARMRKHFVERSETVELD